MMKNSGIILLILLFNVIHLIAQPCDIPPATNNCESAPILCSVNELDGFCTSMSSELTFNAPSPICFNGGAPHNPIWFAFYAGCDEFEMIIQFENCDIVMGTTGVQAAIYSYEGGICPSSMATPDEFLSCTGICPSQETLTLHPVGLVNGNIYYLVIDGCAGSACDLSIFITGSCGEPIIQDWSEPISGPLSTCISSSLTFSIPLPEGATELWWYLDSVELYMSQEDSINLALTTPGTYVLCVDALNPCQSVFEDPAQTCITIEVFDVTSEDPDPVLICANETYSYGGEDYPPGTHEIVLTTSEGCDSVVTLIINSAPVKNTDLGTFYLCESDVVMVANTPITCNDQGSQEIVLQQAAYPFCDSIIEFDVVCVTVDAYVFDPPILEEEQDTVELDGGNSLVDPSFFPTYYNWYMVDTTSWTWVGDSIFHQATEWGTYCLVVRAISPDSMAICSDTFCVVVDSIMSAIHPVASIGQWQISPVPARDLLTIQCRGEKCPGEGVLEFWDVLGRKVHAIQAGDSHAYWEIPICTWAVGPYWITWRKEGQTPIPVGVGVIQR
ncbi:MAG: hypothetical protein K9I85_15135 [Saprospiraceae bacterium]|nr:hypothetical protein [Saprospiraceae bacterium]